MTNIYKLSKQVINSIRFSINQFSLLIHHSVQIIPLQIKGFKFGDMESTLVIKVKNGDTLRRFNTYVGKNGKLVLNVEQLREKMRSLFNLAVDDEFTLTYTDTDGDFVTLVNDCDLDDVVLQCLNPVRMTLTLKSGQKSAYTTTTTESLGININQSIEQIPTCIEKVVEIIPKPLREVLLKLTRDLAAATMTSAPVIVYILNLASKIFGILWESIMDELEEMGFSDKKKNAILLVKNIGSINRVVMDLVSGDLLQ